jgi:phosphate transport system permease protein
MTTVATEKTAETEGTQGKHSAPPRTVVPADEPMVAEPVRRRLGGIRLTDLFAVLGALAAAFSVTAILWTEMSPFTGLLGYVITTWCAFVVIYAALVSFDENRPTMRARVMAVILHSLAVVVLAALGFVIVYTVLKGWNALIHSNFYTQDLRFAGPRDPLTVGGIEHAIVGTLIEIGITLAIAVPLGLLGAVFLHQVPGPFSRFVRIVVDAMTALPDILAGLFVYATLLLTLGLQFSGFAASVALAITILPIVIRASDIVLRLVPGNLLEASYALGSSQWRTVWHILLPTARSGLATAVILGAARAIGETSPVLLTAGFTANLNTDPFHGPMVSLPLEAFESVQSSQPNVIARGFGAAATLLLLVVLLFVIARLIGGKGAGQLSTRQRAGRAAGSRRDLERMSGRHQPAPPHNDVPEKAVLDREGNAE